MIKETYLDRWFTKLMSESMIDESKADQEKFIQTFDQQTLDDFQRLKNRISKFASTDLIYHTKNTSKDQMAEIISRAENREYSAPGQAQSLDIEGKLIPAPANTKQLLKKIGAWSLYFVTDVSDMIDLSSDKYSNCIGKWCIGGRYAEDKFTPEDVDAGKVKLSQAKKLFNAYLKYEVHNDGYYVVIGPNEKYCVLYDKELNIVHSVWDTNNKDLPVLPEQVPSEISEAIAYINVPFEKSVYDFCKRYSDNRGYVQIIYTFKEVLKYSAGRLTTPLFEAFKSCLKSENLNVEDMKRLAEACCTSCTQADLEKLPEDIQRLFLRDGQLYPSQGVFFTSIAQINNKQDSKIFLPAQLIPFSNGGYKVIVTPTPIKRYAYQIRDVVLNQGFCDEEEEANDVSTVAEIYFGDESELLYVYAEYSFFKNLSKIYPQRVLSVILNALAEHKIDLDAGEHT